MKHSAKVAVIYGGVSGEHEVSIASGNAVAEALIAAGYEITRIYIRKDGIWTLAESGEPVILLAGGILAHYQVGTILKEIDRVDIVFPVLHGTLGEDGTLQGMLDVLAIPYVGSGVLGSALGMDKLLQKRVLQQAGLPVGKYIGTSRREIRANTEKLAIEIENQLGYPNFIKPVNLGSSVGISKAHNRQELIAGLLTACLYDRKVIVEAGIDAREIEVSVIGNDEPQATMPGEVLPGREFYDYDAKYKDCGSVTVAPANLPVELAENIRSMAIAVFKALDLAGLARVDFLLDKQSGQCYVSEANTIPGFTEISMFAKLWVVSGVSFPELATKLVELGFERYAEQQESLNVVKAG